MWILVPNFAFGRKFSVMLKCTGTISPLSLVCRDATGGEGCEHEMGARTGGRDPKHLDYIAFGLPASSLF